MKAYYDEHLDQFERQDILILTIVPWQDGRAGDAYTLTLDEDSVRELQEHHDGLIAAALELEAGEESTVDLGVGSYLQVLCESRTDTSQLPFENVTQAALSQLTAQRFDAELQRRLADANTEG